MISPNYWKLSHGAEHFCFGNMIDAISNGRVCMHKATGALGRSEKTQAQWFAEAPIGDYFYLTYGNRGVYLFGQFIGPVNFFTDFGLGWIDRPFRLIKSAKDGNRYDDDRRWWSPNFSSTFAPIPEDDHEIFEQKILKPFFEITLSKYGL